MTSGPILFVVDTGATRTTISATDAMKLGVDCKTLREGQTAHGVGGQVKTYSLEDVLLTFRRIDGELHYEHLSDVCVLEGSDDGLPSLLGLDVLSKYKIAFKRKVFYLES